MEDDFQQFSPEVLEGIKKFKIPYKFRDSCLTGLIELKKCEENHQYLKSFYCKDLSNLWENCQDDRERKIIMSSNVAPVPLEKRKLSY